VVFYLRMAIADKTIMKIETAVVILRPLISQKTYVTPKLIIRLVFWWMMLRWSAESLVETI
jgi:hypothetical protein